MKVNFYLTSHVKIHSKWVKDLNGRVKVTEFLKHKCKSLGYGITQCFLDIIPNEQASREK